MINVQWNLVIQIRDVLLPTLIVIVMTLVSLEAAIAQLVVLPPLTSALNPVIVKLSLVSPVLVASPPQSHATTIMYVLWMIVTLPLDVHTHPYLATMETTVPPNPVTPLKVVNITTWFVFQMMNVLRIVVTLPLDAMRIPSLVMIMMLVLTMVAVLVVVAGINL
jgi:hypothetical protein